MAAARALVEGLVAAGVRDLVLCPGSRSAPVAYAAHAAEQAGVLRLHVRHDERGAAFVALGCGAADPSRPAAIVTTSGTAVANLHPAVLEAHHAAVPMIVLTADRPHRLRGSWANQTSHLQAGLFGGAPIATRDLQAPAGAPDEGAAHEWFGIAVDAVHTAVHGTAGFGRPGPVHLNLGFDDPLVPERLQPWTAPRPPQSETAEGAGRTDVTTLDRGPLTVVVAGDRSGPGARLLAEQAGWPLLAEPTSGSKGGACRVGAYRLLLDGPGLGDRVRRVVAFGHPTLSRPVTRLLARDDVELVQVVRSAADLGPERPARRVLGEVRVKTGGGSPSEIEWLGSWVESGRAAERGVEASLDDWPEMSGPLLAREVVRATGSADLIVVAASNPVRDLDLVAPPVDGAVVLANRGLSGIDGTIGTAVGAAVVTGRATRLLVGDLAFLHDLGSLALPPAERDRLRLQVVVLNDDGGGIFGLLEHGDHTASFERVFATPHGSDLAALCAGLSVPMRSATGKAELQTLLADVPRGLSVVEVRASRASLRPLHAALRRAVGPGA